MKQLLRIITSLFLAILKLILAIILHILGWLLQLLFGSNESRDTKRISAITAEIEHIQQQDLFGDDKSESAQNKRDARKKSLFSERERLFAKYPD